MTDTDQLAFVYTTLPSADDAEALGRSLVESRLAACANIYPNLISIYCWNDTVERANEAGLLIKTPRSRLETLLREMRARHPYETPLLAVLPVETVNADYLDWALAGTAPTAA